VDIAATEKRRLVVCRFSLLPGRKVLDFSEAHTAGVYYAIGQGGHNEPVGLWRGGCLHRPITWCLAVSPGLMWVPAPMPVLS